MIKSLYSLLEADIPHHMGGWTLADVGARLSPIIAACRLLKTTDKVIPYGRYLLHEAPSFNVQLDAFSPEYRGGIHRHGTWGIFVVLRGTLFAEDFDHQGQSAERVSAVSVGGASGFAAQSDWHRVSTGAGPQVVSLHIYGEGFDLDIGQSMDESGQVRSYRRSPFGDNAALEGLWR